MRMIRAVIRPDREEQVVNALESSGIVSLTKMDVFGRGQQKGVQVGNTIYSELPKVMLTIVVEESKLDGAIAAIQAAAKTGQHGDGKIFISPVDAVYTDLTDQSACIVGKRQGFAEQISETCLGAISDHFDGIDEVLALCTQTREAFLFV